MTNHLRNILNKLPDSRRKKIDKRAKELIIQELIDLALQEFMKPHRQKDVRDLQGKIKIDDKYNYKQAR